MIWSLHNLTFNDGGSAFGSLAYDPFTGLYSDINIHTLAGTTRAGADYAFVSPGLSPTSNLVLVNTLGAGDLTATPGLAFLFATPLTNAGGSILVSIVQEADCATPDCSNPALPARTLNGQIATIQASVADASVAAPEPASGTIVFCALTAGWLCRRSRRRSRLDGV